MKKFKKTSGQLLKLPDTVKLVAMTLVGTALIVAIVAMCASAASAQPFGAAPAVSDFAGWVLSKQAIFYRALSGTILMAKTDGSAL